MKLKELFHDLIKLAISFTPLSGAIQFYHTLKKWINEPKGSPILEKEGEEKVDL